MMADCNETLREMEAFLDGELTEDATLALHAHLEGCQDCLQAFDFQAELKAVIAEKCRQRPDARRPPVAHRAVPRGRPRRRRHRIAELTRRPAWLSPTHYAGVMLAAEIWHWWIGVVLTLVAVGTVLMLVVGYLKQVTAQRYPNRRQREG